jgi:hypothetical protein
MILRFSFGILHNSLVALNMRGLEAKMGQSPEIERGSIFPGQSGGFDPMEAVVMFLQVVARKHYSEKTTKVYKYEISKVKTVLLRGCEPGGRGPCTVGLRHLKRQKHGSKD